MQAGPEQNAACFVPGNGRGTFLASVFYEGNRQARLEICHYILYLWFRDAYNFLRRNTMRDVEVCFKVKCMSEEELPSNEIVLVEAAREAALRAYAPYSAFKVGAALFLENGEVITGNNQENAAYPSGMCAERAALFYANSRYPFVPVKILVITAYHNHAFVDKISPCGACRQALLEAEKRFGKPVKILLAGTREIRVVGCVADLLPLAFDSF